jgi:RimJ/RimL family protein N-acetyltransferase
MDGGTDPGGRAALDSASGVGQTAGMESVALQTIQVIRPKAVIGSRLRFRDATPDDAAFILALRLDPTKNRYLSAVDDDLGKQRAWLERYATDPTQAYFIIEALDGRAVGTVRLYDPQGMSFALGSWIVTDDAPRLCAAESTTMAWAYGLELGFTACHFDVRKENRICWSYNEQCGAERVGETPADYLYVYDHPTLHGIVSRHVRRSGKPIQILF